MNAPKQKCIKWPYIPTCTDAHTNHWQLKLKMHTKQTDKRYTNEWINHYSTIDFDTQNTREWLTSKWNNTYVWHLKILYLGWFDLKIVNFVVVMTCLFQVRYPALLNELCLFLTFKCFIFIVLKIDLGWKKENNIDAISFLKFINRLI